MKYFVTNSPHTLYHGKPTITPKIRAVHYGDRSRHHNIEWWMVLELPYGCKNNKKTGRLFDDNRLMSNLTTWFNPRMIY